MNIDIEDIPRNASRWEVKAAFARVLHGPEFYDPAAHKARKVNFDVTLQESHNASRNNGKGTLTLPDKEIGQRFFRWVLRPKNRVSVDGRKLWLKPGTEKLKRGLVEALNKTLYLDPKDMEVREEKLDRIRRIRIIIDVIQFGVFFRRPEDPVSANRYFSNEYEIYRDDTFAGEFLFDYDHKLFRIEMGDSVSDAMAEHIVIDLANIKKSAYGSDPDGAYYVCLDLWAPPRFERQPRFRKYSGDRRKDARNFRERLPHLGGPHEAITQHAFQLRLVLNDPRARKDLRNLCEEAGIRTPSKVSIGVENYGFFRPEVLNYARAWMLKFEWPVRFQLEAMLRNGLAHTGDLYSLRTAVEELVHERPDFVADFLRRLSEKLKSKSPSETVHECFQNALEREKEDAVGWLDGNDLDSPRTKGSVQCAHAIVTPTRVLLEGPYDTQSNRVIRRYYEYRDNFIRVEFREENRMSFRWPIEVNARSLVEQRFGKILKEGLKIADRVFRFLGYSTSGLREHTAWFMADFEHRSEGLVTAENIRANLGDFEKCIRHPSKYAARIAQAFSGTDPSVRITSDQWEDGVEDLGENPYEFTDGQGTISEGLRDRIWEELVKASPDKGKFILKPSVFQIRFLGFKGIVVLDKELPGIRMRLRPSMKKFDGHGKEDAEIEIAKAFISPGTARLCRPLIAVLEDRGVRKEAFLKLQNIAKDKVAQANNTLKAAAELLQKHGIGNVFGLRWILQHLAEEGLVLRREHGPKYMDNEFVRRLISFAQTHVMREIKHDARITIDDAYQLVGAADEGPAYVAMGHKNVFCLKEGEIFACVQQPDKDEPIYIEGLVSISRSPHIHPGDVQRVRAIGKPPDDPNVLCLFRGLKNVVVMPSVGPRSLASCLAGGDVDGDEYLVIKDPSLLPVDHAVPASYVGVKATPLDRDSTTDDICNFFIEYMQSDVVGLVADQHLIIADQSPYGTFDSDCMILAEMCSQAVDYPKNGVPVDIEKMPRPKMHAKPDWKKKEDDDPRPGDYYESSRAIGELFRNINFREVTPADAPSSSYPNGTPLSPIDEPPLSDGISRALRRTVSARLERFYNEDEDIAALEPLFRHYARELGYVCLTHAPSDNADVRLSEEEVAVGVILAKCSQRRWKQERTHRMREHVGQLVRDVKYRRRGLGVPLKREKGEEPEREELVAALAKGWAAWDFGMRNRAVFGARSFGLIGLGVVCEMLEKLEKLDPSAAPA